MKPSTTVSKLAIWLSWLAALIIAILPFHALLTVWASSAIGLYTFLRLWKELLLIVLVAGCLYLIVKDLKLRRKISNSLITPLILVYCLISLVWGLAAYGFHKVALKSLEFGLIVNLRFLIFFLCTWIIATKSPILKRVWLKLLLIPAAVVIFVGLLQRLVLPYDFLKHFGYNQNTIYPYETINHNINYPRIMSTLRGANPLGAYMVLILSSIAATFTHLKKNRWVWGLFGIAALLTLIFSYSRGAWAGLLISLVVLAGVSLKSGRVKNIFLAALALAIVITVVAILTLRHNSTFQNIFFHTETHTMQKTSSNSSHVSAFRTGMHDVVHEPIGKGVGTAGPASVYNGAKPRIAENYFIQIAQEVGWIGLALFLTINLLVGYELWRRRGHVLAIALLASLAGLTVINLVSHAWTDDTIAYIWWGLAGVALAMPVKSLKR